jgi:hypothetical protein
LRFAVKVQAELYAAVRSDGVTRLLIDIRQTRADLYDTGGLKDGAALDVTIGRGHGEANPLTI